MSSALQKPLGSMSLAELRRLIDQRIAAQVPPIPTQVQKLADLDIPLVAPDVPTNDTVLKWDGTRVHATKVTAAVLEAIMVLASTIVAGDPNGARIELGLDQTDPTQEGMRAFDATSAQTFNVDAQDGSVYMKGRLDFGSGSRLMANDALDIEGQPTAGFLTPSRVQRGGVSGNYQGFQWSTVNFSFNAPTVSGNTLLLVVDQNSQTGSTPAVPTCSGWTQVQTKLDASSTVRQTVFKIENAASHSTTMTVNFGSPSNTRSFAIQFMEYGNVGVVDVVPAAATGTSTTPTTPASGTLAQAGEVVVAFFLDANNANQLIDTPTNGFSIWGQAAANNSGQGVKSTVADLNVTATTSVSTGVTDHAGARTWIAQLVSLKADSAGTPTSIGAPDTGKARIFALSNGAGHPLLHGIDDVGNANSYAMAPGGVGYRIEVATVSVTIPTVSAQSGGSTTVSIASLAAGDFCFFVGTNQTGAGTQLIYFTSSLVTTPGQVTLRYFNADTTSKSPAAANFYFLVVHIS